jgi:hypothetical protein
LQVAHAVKLNNVAPSVQFLQILWGAHGMASQSPLTDAPLRLPGQSLDEEIDKWQNERVINYFITAGTFFVLTFEEWWGYLTHAPRQPILFSVCAVLAIGALAWRVIYIRARLRPLKLGRNGERVVGQYLEGFRAYGVRVFHDIPGDDFNVDHVCRQEPFYSVESPGSFPMGRWPQRLCCTATPHCF